MNNEQELLGRMSNIIEEKKFVYEEMQRTCNKQWETIDIIDTKAIKLFEILVASVFLGLGFILWYSQNFTRNRFVAGFLWAGLVLWFLALLLAHATLKIKSYNSVPAPKGFWDMLYDEKPAFEYVLDTLIATVVEVHAQNEKIINQKIESYEGAFSFWILGLFFMIFAVFIGGW